MITKLECGCTVDDERVSTVHEQDGKHYPIGTTMQNFCKRCDLYKPCLCTFKLDMTYNPVQIF